MPAKVRKFSPKVRRIAKEVILGSAVKSSERWGDFIIGISDEEVGEKLRELRKSKKVKAQDVASAMQCEGTTICNLEMGRSKWNADKVLEYVDAVVELAA